MDVTTRLNLDNLRSDSRELQDTAFSYFLSATEAPVDWAYDIWDEMVENLHHKSNRVRAIAAQVLCNLAKSDPEERILRDIDSLISVTKDERFVTARHCLQSLWKVGVVGIKQQQKVIDGLEGRFKECITEKNATLIRYDIVQCLRRMYDEKRDETIAAKALALIESEDDAKYRKKYASVWRVR